MAETFFFLITERVLGRVSSLALDEISLAWSIKTQLKKLENTLSTLKAVLLDANEQQARNHEVRDWPEKLQDVVYDVDDLLDDLSTLVLRQKLESSQGKFKVLKKVRDFFSSSNPVAFRLKIGRRLREIRERLEGISADRKDFHFAERIVVQQAENKAREQTHSFIRASDIIGRENDKEIIVEQLLSSADDHDHDNYVSVLTIVGLGGLGKTTLVKLVYNDSRVVQNFDLRMWVCVSEDFNLRQIIEKIIRSATGESFGHLDMDQMQARLRNILDSKFFLLVLDDVWNDDRNRWLELRDLLVNGNCGSKIVVTTRSKNVAKIAGTIPAYNLSGLSDDDCFSLFLKCAFRGERNSNSYPNLVEIGKEIVKKCGGVPLAVKTLGSLLYMKNEEPDWLHIRDNDIWKIEQKESDILPLLRLSYDQMPSYLRQCFAYCSIFPKGNEIPREEFINLWIAQGFIESTQGNRPLEDIGNQFFNELLSRFCFQDVKEAFDGEVLACKIHNLVHDLAQSVAAAECLNVKFETKVISERVRHVFLEEDFSGKAFPESLPKARNLRSLSCSFKDASIKKSLVETIIWHFGRLRVLVLNSLEVVELPRSIGHLKQLRYLSLSHNRNIRALPSSICRLLNLQTLNLINCEQLEGLPRNSGKLVNLKTLYLTSKQLFLPNKHLQSLDSLEYLLLYKCDHLTSLPKELTTFTALRVLRIYECSNIASLPSSIKHLTALEKLWIWDCEELDLLEGEGLGGLTSLRSLLLMGLPKLVHLPEGLKETAANSLQYLRIANCPSLTTLPDWLQNCTSLLRLYIEDCPNLSYLPEGVHCLSAKVHINSCPKLNGGN